MSMFDSPTKGYDSRGGTIDFYQNSRVHYRELHQYLVFYLARKTTSEPDYRAGARCSLPRLTVTQFHELSTDCYEELLRRTRVGERRALAHLPMNIPTSLPIRDDIHPRRNMARQRLAAFPVQRFMDLLSDVHFELARRYPEFKEA